jgi:hypothetical protein
MTDMIEKMARAIAEVEDYYQQTADADDVWKTYIPHAKAVLSALEDPSEEMVEAGNKSLTWGIVPDDELRAALTAMIKAAKGEE